MAGLPVSKVLFGFLLLVFVQGCWSRTLPSSNEGCTGDTCAVDISCMFINWEYVNCSWTRPQMHNINYNFSSRLREKTYQECPQYLQEHGQNVGCRIPFKVGDQFSPFYTKLSIGRNQSVIKDYEQLTERVKFNPPTNLSVSWTGPGGSLCLHWVSSITKKRCLRYMVRYQKGSDPRQYVHNTTYSPYCENYASSNVNFTFQVRSKPQANCGNSDFWSDWSDPVQWGNYTESIPESTSPPWWPVWLSVLGVIVLITLTLLLCYCESIKILILPVVPDPRKNLQDLFREHNGNVESWVHSSRLKEAFETDYTETPCIVGEPKGCDGPPLLSS